MFSYIYPSLINKFKQADNYDYSDDDDDDDDQSITESEDGFASNLVRIFFFTIKYLLHDL